MAPYRPPARDLTRALDELPLLVLQHTVLFPGVRVQVEVRSARNVRAVRQALNSHWALGVVPPARRHTPGATRPRIAGIGGVGSIVEHADSFGGRCELVLLGRGRVRLREGELEQPYRYAAATILPSLDTPVSPATLAALYRVAGQFAQRIRQRDRSFRFELTSHEEPGRVADQCAHELVVDAHQRQQVLETLDVRDRVLHVTEVLTAQCRTLAAEGDDRIN